MLIRSGKAEGWLHLDVDGVKAWATASGIQFSNASPKNIPGRGIGLTADRDLSTSEHGKPWEILSVAEDLVLSVEAVKRHALYDQDFRAVLESIGDFGRIDRTRSILSRLENVIRKTTLSSYVKTLPCEMLPTFWTADELQLLVGTTLAPAVSSKLKSLQREFDLLCESAANTRWYKIVEPILTFDDWLQVDAMFRSRALDFYGSCMIPGMDLASHAAGERTNAFYDRTNGKYSLWLLEEKPLRLGEEVTITYGDEKGACEMLFSYGFLEDQMVNAETLFLNLSIPDEDMSRAAKLRIADCAPGFKIIDVSEGRFESNSIDESDDSESQGNIDWKGDFVWLLCVTEEDGLKFEVARTVHGDEELRATFQGVELEDGAAELRRLLAQTSMWLVFRLRAIVILQQRVFEQLQVLYESQDDIENTPHGGNTEIREGPYQQALKLRRLEFELLEKAYEDFERQKVELAGSPVVQEYLANVNQEQAQQPEEDFS